MADEPTATRAGPRSEPPVGPSGAPAPVDPDGGCVLAVDLSGEAIARGAVVSLRGEVRHRAALPMSGAQGEAAYDAVVELLELLLTGAPPRVVGIGVGAPGLIDDDGVVRYGSLRRWSNLPLAPRLSAHFDLPTHVGNDINMAALGALHFRGIDARDLLLISIENSVGMGVVIGERLVPGEHFAAGEIGHLTVSEDGATCVCGRAGCLEVYISAARKAARSSYISAERRSAAFMAAGWALGIVLAPIATALNLSTVILAGPPALVTEQLVDAALRTVADRTIPIINTGVDVIPLAGDDDLILLGSAARVLQEELGIPSFPRPSTPDRQ